MKIELIPKALPQYKANLHSHSTLSNGKVTPAEMKAGYKARGYSVLAITDHNIFLTHNGLTDENFLMLNGIEYNVNADDGTGRTCHFCAIAGSKETEIQPFFHRTKYVWGGGLESIKRVRFDATLSDYERIYSAEKITEMMRGCRDKGFFVTYNHPRWSLEHYPEYMRYDGFHAMEIMNYGSLRLGFPEYNEQVYDDMLTGGKRVFCSATDDNHTASTDAFVFFNYILAEKLTYESVMEALFAGRMYASTGAEISAMYIEDGKLHVEVPNAKEIRIFTGFRNAARVLGTKEKPVTEMEWALPDDPRCKYFRVTVTDFEGNQAFSRAYFFDELGIALSAP